MPSWLLERNDSPPAWSPAPTRGRLPTSFEQATRDWLAHRRPAVRSALATLLVCLPWDPPTLRWIRVSPGKPLICINAFPISTQYADTARQSLRLVTGYVSFL